MVHAAVVDLDPTHETPALATRLLARPPRAAVSFTSYLHRHFGRRPAGIDITSLEIREKEMVAG